LGKWSKKQTIDSKLYLPKQTCSDEENTNNAQDSETPDEFNKYQRKLYVVILIATPLKQNHNQVPLPAQSILLP
jgi:hypothetical protein